MSRDEWDGGLNQVRDNKIYEIKSKKKYFKVI